MVEIKEELDLHNDKGELNIAGYSKEMLLKYDRNRIKASKLKIKEWDYYLVYNQDYVIALTVADNSYMGLLSASVIRFKDKTEKTTSIMTLFPMGKLNTNLETQEHINMPSSSKTGDIIVKNKKCDIRFLHDGKNRRLYCFMPNFDKNKSLEVDLTLTSKPKQNMVIATPFKENKKAFYYNQKIVGFKAYGEVKINNEVINFKQADTYALLDWGRGVWTYKNTWYWGAGMGEVNGKVFGFNIGYGFGDTSNASENMLFFDGKAHKLDQVTFNIPKKDSKYDYLSNWTFTSNDKRFEMNFTPIINRHADTNALILRSNQNQVFGYFTGHAVLDNGERIEINNLLGFAEKVYNKW